MSVQPKSGFSFRTETKNWNWNLALNSTENETNCNWPSWPSLSVLKKSQKQLIFGVETQFPIIVILQ